MLNQPDNIGLPTFGYIRVSSEEQAQEGLSLLAQEQAIRAYAAHRGLNLVEVIADPAVSGGRPLGRSDGGGRLLEGVAKGNAKAVVAVKLDRLFRSAQDCLSVVDSFDRKGVALHLLDVGGQGLDNSSALGRFFLTVMAAVGEMEKGLIAERTKAALAARKARGQTNGGQPPYGFAADDDGYLEDPAEQEVLDHVRKLRVGRCFVPSYCRRA